MKIEFKKLKNRISILLIFKSINAKNKIQKNKLVSIDSLEDVDEKKISFKATFKNKNNFFFVNGFLDKKTNKPSIISDNFHYLFLMK